jgi:hypothetical protein
MSLKLEEQLKNTFPLEAVTGPYQPAVDRIENEHIWKFRLNLQKNKILNTNKQRLTQTISDFEKSNKYTGHITLNVDPI